MSTQIIISPLRKFNVLFTMGGGERDANDATRVPGGEPSLLIVIRAIKFPSFLLQRSEMSDKRVARLVRRKNR